MLFYLFPIFNFNILKSQSQRNEAGFLLIESYSALVLAMFVLLTFVGAFVSWTMHSCDTRSRLRACLYAQAYVERLISENSVRFEPYVYSFSHENYGVSVAFSQDRSIHKFVHVHVALEKKSKTGASNEMVCTFYTGYIYEKSS